MCFERTTFAASDKSQSPRQRFKDECVFRLLQDARCPKRRMRNSSTWFFAMSVPSDPHWTPTRCAKHVAANRNRRYDSVIKLRSGACNDRRFTKPREQGAVAPQPLSRGTERTLRGSTSPPRSLGPTT